MSARVILSSSFEALADRLAEDLRDPLPPLATETVIVQSRAMEKRVAQELAKRLGVCAGVRFPFPIAFAYSLFGQAARVSDLHVFSRQSMALRIFAALPGLIPDTDFAAVRAYLDSDGSELRLMQLAEKIAYLFDSYLIYRPEVILAWDKGLDNKFGKPGATHEPWQARLWRTISESRTLEHRAALKEALHAALNDPERVLRLPKRVAVFCVPSLPRFYIDVFADLSRRVEVIFYQLAPGLPGGAIPKGKTIFPAARCALLDSMGQLGTEHLENLRDTNAELVLLDGPGASAADSSTLLAMLQADIHADRPLGQTKRPVTADDDSLRVHSCHGPMREVEVLHDCLLDFLNRDASLTPADILVLAPDMGSYAPYVEAVFGCAPEDGPRIPFHLTERPASEGPQASVLTALLYMDRSRFEASRVLSILENPAVAARFGLTAGDMDSVRAWVREAGVRWGLDAEHRKRLDLPDFKENTWTFGLARLLLGYAMPGDGRPGPDGILPCDLVEGSDASVLGCLLDFLSKLARLAEELPTARTLRQWRDWLLELLDTFMAETDESADELEDLREAVLEIGRDAEAAEFDGQLGIEALRQCLRSRLKDFGGQRIGLRGGVVFGSLATWRNVPARVLCMLGMNDANFPRRESWMGFDLIAADGKPATGRSPRAEDRQLFLEALCAARDRLHISYVGQSMRDSRHAPPSVLVSELLDAVTDGFESADGGRLLDRIVINHRLQAFHPNYFKGSGPLFSYSRENLDGLRGRLRQEKAKPFFPRPLPIPEGEWQSIRSEQLLSFLRHPVRFLLRERLSLSFFEQEEETMDVEQLSGFDWLEKYTITEQAGRLILDGGSLADLEKSLRAEGRLPPGAMGSVVLGEISEEAREFATRLKATLDGQKRLPPLEASLDLGGRMLLARVDGLWSCGLVRERPSKLKGPLLLTTWAEHLLLNALKPDGCPRETLIVAKNGNWKLKPVDKPLRHLERLAELFMEGLTRPLPLLPRASWQYASAIRDRGKDADTAMEAAMAEWEGNEHRDIEGESAEAYLRLCFPDGPSALPDFCELADEIFAPIFDHREEA